MPDLTRQGVRDLGSPRRPKKGETKECHHNFVERQELKPDQVGTRGRLVSYRSCTLCPFEELTGITVLLNQPAPKRDGIAEELFQGV